MAAGTPVVTSNTSSLPEVGGDAVIYVDPYDIDSIKTGIKSLWQSSDEFRQDLVTRGYARLRLFTWEKTAYETLRFFSSVSSN